MRRRCDFRAVIVSTTAARGPPTSRRRRHTLKRHYEASQWYHRVRVEKKIIQEMARSGAYSGGDVYRNQNDVAPRRSRSACNDGRRSPIAIK